jgi:hypothetical protein
LHAAHAQLARTSSPRDTACSDRSGYLGVCRPKANHPSISVVTSAPEVRATCVYYPGYPYASPNVTPPLMTGRSVAEYPGYATTPEALAADVTAPLMTGRSVAVSPVPGAVAGPGPGNYCATPVTTCRLREPGWLGTGCSCRVADGRARGFVR